MPSNIGQRTGTAHAQQQIDHVRLLRRGALEPSINVVLLSRARTQRRIAGLDLRGRRDVSRTGGARPTHHNCHADEHPWRRRQHIAETCPQERRSFVYCAPKRTQIRRAEQVDKGEFDSDATPRGTAGR